MPRTTLFVALAITCLSSASLAAQIASGQDELQPGAKVRVRAAGIVAGRYVGTVLTRSGDTLTVGSPNRPPFVLPMSRITSLEISRGKSHADGAIRGIEWGAPIGLVIGLFTIGLSDNCIGCQHRHDDFGTGVTDVATSTAGGALWGAGIGALIGREHWEPFDVAHHTAIGIHPGGASLALRYEF